MSLAMMSYGVGGGRPATSGGSRTAPLPAAARPRTSSGAMRVTPWSSGGSRDIHPAAPQRPSTSEGLRSGRFRGGLRHHLDAGLDRHGVHSAGGGEGRALRQLRAAKAARQVRPGTGEIITPHPPLVRPMSTAERADSLGAELRTQCSVGAEARGGWPSWRRSVRAQPKRVGQSQARRQSHRCYLDSEGGALVRSTFWQEPTRKEIASLDELRQRNADAQVFQAAFHLIDLDRSGKVGKAVSRRHHHHQRG
jgi:hypothetical protein